MQNEIEDWFDLVVLIVLLVCSVAVNLPLVNEWNYPISSEMKDKSVVTTSDLSDTRGIETGQDVLDMLLAMDLYVPYPRAIRIGNSQVIKLDVAWVAYRDREVQRIISEPGYVELGDKLDKKVLAVNYVFDDPDADGPYWHYVLED